MAEKPYMTDADLAELEEAKRAVVDAKRLRQRVLARVRQRRCRAGKERKP